jgi:chitinase
VFELTFDYNFAVMQKTRKTKRAVEQEVDELRGGDMHAYLDHHFCLQRRSTPDAELHLLHARWFSIVLDDWIDRMGNVELNHTLLRHRIDEVADIHIYRSDTDLPDGARNANANAKLTVVVGIEVETSAQFIIMGNLDDLSSFKQSHLTMRNRGSATVLVNFDAFARIELGSVSKELTGFAPMGASIIITGSVTIGPQFKVVSSLKGVMDVHA